MNDTDNAMAADFELHRLFANLKEDLDRKLYRDEMHEKHPDLKEAWERYEILYSLYKKDNS